MPIFELKYNDIENFLSQTQISEHYKLYANYYNQSQDLPPKINGLSQTNPSSVRGVQKVLQYALAGRDLHELYFGGMTTSTTSLDDMGQKTKELIEKSFGSVQTWFGDFVTCAMGARGWAILEIDPKAGLAYNVVADFHDEGSTAGFVPVLALDMYEHAYFYDYQTNKKAYIDNYFKHVDWAFVEAIVSKALKD